MQMPRTVPIVNHPPVPQLRDASTKVPTRVRHLKHMIGNTPLLAVRLLFRGKLRVVYAKAEHINMTGSIKDRMAFHILNQAYH
jgi:cysteine synthase A